jgi:methylmalonyl-CoA/ethylmalonyl-CoA epimerase
MLPNPYLRVQNFKAMFTIEHLGIAVKNMEEGEALFSKILNVSPYKREEVESEGVITSFFQAGEGKIELLTPTREDSVMTKFLEKKGEGIHHIAFAVEDIRSEMKRLQEEGFVLIHTEPKRGADNKWICFLHPKHTSGVLIELCQEVRDTEDGF